MMRKSVRESTGDGDAISSNQEEGEFEEYDSTGVCREDLSEYELIRLQKIRENREVFEQLGVVKAKSEISASRFKPPSACVALKSRKTKIPQKWNNNKNPFNRRKPAAMDMKCKKMGKGELEKVIKGWLDVKMKKSAQAMDLAMDVVGSGENSKLKPDGKVDPISSVTGIGQSGMEMNGKSDVERYRIYDEYLVVHANAQVNPTSAYTQAWYPSQTKRMIFQGDRKGIIGVWDLNQGNGNQKSIFHFEVHAARPISHIGFDPSDSTKLYSCCHDGTLSCGDLNQAKFVRKFAFDKHDDEYINHFVWPSNMQNTLLGSTYFGDVINLDLNSGKPVQTYTLGNRLRCIDCHPLNGYLICTVYDKGYKVETIDVWDWRMLKERSDTNGSISSFTAGKMANKACFSPQTGNKILMTAQDKCLRVLDVDQSSRLTLRHTIQDDHYQGVAGTAFAATWDPKTDNVFSCGSLNRVRRVDLFCCEESSGKVLSSSLYSEDMMCLSSLNIFHPRLPLLASAGGAGRINVWALPTDGDFFN